MGLFSNKKQSSDGYYITKSRLQRLSGDAYDIEAEKIVQEYGAVVAEVMSQVRTKYRAMVFPSSKLPASKADIREAFDMFLEPGHFDFPEEQQSSLESIYMILDRFIEDEDAKAKNQEYAEAAVADKTSTMEV
jgi:hypothetical protein